MTLEPSQLSDQDMAVTCAYLDLQTILRKLEAVGLAESWRAEASRTLEDVAAAFPELHLTELKVTH